MRLFEPVHLIYDGQCGFCLRALSVVRRFDRFRLVRYHDAHDRRAIEAGFPALTALDLSEAMYLVTAGGRVYRGFFAFRRLVWLSPLTWPLFPLFYIPGSGFVGARVYAWVARNRHRFGCQSEVCVFTERVGPAARPTRPGQDPV